MAIQPTCILNRRDRNQTTGTNTNSKATAAKSKGIMSYPFRRLSFRTSIVPLSLNATNINASPTVASMAAAAME
jgi:hypothetical protein